MKDKKENPKPKSATPPPPKPPVEKSTAEQDLDTLALALAVPVPVPVLDDVFVDSKFEGRVEGEFEVPTESKKSISAEEEDPSANTSKGNQEFPPLDAFLKEQEEAVIKTTPFTEEERDAIFKEGNANIVSQEEVYKIPETQFKSPLDPSERKHYQMVLKSNKETISELRKQLTVALAENKSLSKKSEN